ncbi:MAG: site-specific integrase [Phycisphaerales bacterium]|nr:site-specific integrase [Phycisphaerales bacterium]
MASVICDPNGLKRIQFIASDGSKKTIRLGKATTKQADAFKVRVEQLVLIATGATPVMDDEVARWVVGLGDKIHGRLAKVGLVQPRERTSATLGKFLDDYFASLSVKSGTETAYDHTRRYLNKFFGENRILRSIDPADADQWRQHLRDAKLSASTVARRVGVARQMFKRAVKWKLIHENPFADVKGGSQVNKARMFFVTRDMAEKVLDACIDAQWRLLFALSRFGGLRCPSEHLGLRWGDVDWEKGRMLIRSPKTEHHEGGESRMVPIFPELLPYLREVFELAEPGTEHVITRYRDPAVNLRTQLLRIIAKAGLQPWPKLWQNLRSTRETELAERYPLHVVCAWIGNSRAVAQQHYLQVTDEHFEQAAMVTTAPPNPIKKATQKATQQPDVLPRQVSQLPEETAFCGQKRDIAIPNEDLVGAVGFEPT